MVETNTHTLSLQQLEYIVEIVDENDYIKEKCDLVVKDCNDGGVGLFLFDTLIQKQY